MVVALCGLAVVGCREAPAYVHDISAKTVAEAAMSAIGQADEYMDGTSNYFSYYFEGERASDMVDDCRLMFHRQETNVNEIGVFRVSDKKNAQAVEQMAHEYLDQQTKYLRSFAANYSPTDMEKIDNADICVMGNYVISYILTPKDEQAMLDAVRTLLTKAK